MVIIYFETFIPEKKKLFIKALIFYINRAFFYKNKLMHELAELRQEKCKYGYQIMPKQADICISFKFHYFLKSVKYLFR